MNSKLEWNWKQKKQFSELKIVTMLGGSIMMIIFVENNNEIEIKSNQDHFANVQFRKLN